MFVNNEQQEREYNYSIFCCLYIIIVFITANCIALDFHSRNNKYIRAQIFTKICS